jgi:hypothetical protein
MAISGRKPKPEGQAIHRNKLAHGSGKPGRRCRTASCGVQRSGTSRWTRSSSRRWSTDGEPRHATELRNREKMLGTTMDFRRDLRIRYVDPEEPRRWPTPR